MPTTRDARDRLTSGPSQLLCTGRQPGVAAADSLHGDLPSHGWALLVPLERDGDQRCSAPAVSAGTDGSVAALRLTEAGAAARDLGRPASSRVAS